MTTLIQALLNGLSLGSIYALIALGYTMVYGIAKMLNFAHGDVIMVGAYAVISSVVQAKMPGAIGVVISILTCALLGITIEFLAYRPLRKAPSLTVLITAIGVSYLLQNIAQLVYGTEQKAFPELFESIPTLTVGGVRLEGSLLLTLGLTAIIMVALTLFINHTRIGKAMRAVSEDKEAAELMGISVNKTITITNSLDDNAITAAIINGNFALDAGLSPAEDAIFVEPAEGDVAAIFANYVVVNPEDAEADWLKALEQCLCSEKVSDYMLENENYAGGVIPFFSVEE